MAYHPKDFEKSIAKNWLKIGYREPHPDGKTFCVMVPPPNVTGTLHLGHGLQYAVMDTLIRHKRALGDQVLLQVGTDHAGIATQRVVELQLEQKGLKRTDMGRDAFLDAVWSWKSQSGNIIAQQMKQIGLSANWEHERFTLDDDFSHSVRHTFVELYRKGFIYRGKRLVNWDTVLQTAVSDLEVSSETRQGQIWYIRYPIDDRQHLVVATTRPETMLGDTAVCVHPDDERYQHLIGSSILLPLTNRQISIIADDSIDPEFGSGCVKITPAHDFNDHEIGKRHKLEVINIFNLDGSMNEHCPEGYQGMDRFIARKAIVNDLDELGLIEKVEPHTAALPIGDRSQSVIEPMLTDQWYIRMDSMADQALADLKAQAFEFIPSNWDKTFENWLDGIDDWCISRQLWWGHRIPAYYDESGQIYVGHSEEEIRQQHPNIGALTQDADVLDTWFSSALWPFATLGWPKQTERYETFYPNHLLVTGFDIIFFWVARMIMMGTELTDQIPFPKIYVTGLINDERGQKMSKSRGNTLDPIDIIEGATLDKLLEKRTTGMMKPKLKEAAIKATKKAFPNGIEPHGTDALRFTFLLISTHAKELHFDLNKLRSSRNFCNKIWNAHKFLAAQPSQPMEQPGIIEQAILHEFNQFIQTTQQHLDDYRFDLYAQTIYDYFWHHFCDWYLELAKVSDNEQKQQQRIHFLSELYDQLLIVVHPALPFITEELWQSKHGRSETITFQDMANASKYPLSERSLGLYSQMRELIKGIRNIRSELNIAPKTTVLVYCVKDPDQIITQFKPEIMKLAGVSTIENIDHAPKNTCGFIHQSLEVAIDLSGVIEPQHEINRLEKKIAKLIKEQDKLLSKTQNPNYQKKAPDELKRKDQELIDELKQNLDLLNNYLKIIQTL